MEDHIDSHGQVLWNGNDVLHTTFQNFAEESYAHLDALVQFGHLLLIAICGVFEPVLRICLHAFLIQLNFNFVFSLDFYTLLNLLLHHLSVVLLVGIERRLELSLKHFHNRHNFYVFWLLYIFNDSLVDFLLCVFNFLLDRNHQVVKLVISG